MHWVISLAIGGLVGWLASLVMKTNDQMGCIANILVGVGGSLLGYFVAGLLRIAPRAALLRFAVAVGGAVVLIAILQGLGLLKKA
mgnify:CR=1 FL=1